MLPLALINNDKQNSGGTRVGASTSSTTALTRRPWILFVPLLLALLIGVLAPAAARAEGAVSSWGAVAEEMGEILDQAEKAYLAGDVEAGKDGVNTAYYRRYETLGFEKQVMARISGNRVSTVEMEFSLVKKAMTDRDDAAVAQHVADLKNYLREDANTLDGYVGEAAAPTSPWLSGFLPSLLVILREGMEAILVVAAILAYLAKAGHKDKSKVVWVGVALALVASAILAVLFSAFANLAGANQELLEGVAALFAVAMLIWVSNWMVSKSSNEAWDRYIKDQTDASLSRGSLLGLAAIAFLAVLREGAETILFYVPVISHARVDRHGGRRRHPRRGLPPHPIRRPEDSAAPLLRGHIVAPGGHGRHLHRIWRQGAPGGRRPAPDASR